ncbi:CPBP family intramembrane glutamic endopeptidase [Treponema sp.]|uniref:CPBP family intramembrane glutamic endopeptidase n=1 Tax=Treponema sp. TaxID=166 RepID=UPI00388DB7ED
MKKRYILIEFLFILIFLALPPLFVTNGHGLSKAGSFSPAVLIQLAIAITLQLQYRFQFQERMTSRAAAIFKIPFWWSITLGCLMLIFALMQTLTLFFEKEALSRNILPSLNSIVGWFFLVFTVTSAAFYEEVLYRMFIPEFLGRIMDSKMEKKLVYWTVEIFCVLIFALAHRYLGWISVFNAFACGSILRICFKKTSSVWTGAAAHFIYNMTLIIFSLLS